MPYLLKKFVKLYVSYTKKNGFNAAFYSQFFFWVAFFAKSVLNPMCPLKCSPKGTQPEGFYFGVLNDFPTVLNDKILTRVLSDRVLCRVLSDIVLSQVLCDRVLFRVMNDTVHWVIA